MDQEQAQVLVVQLEEELDDEITKYNELTRQVQGLRQTLQGLKYIYPPGES